MEFVTVDSSDGLDNSLQDGVVAPTATAENTMAFVIFPFLVALAPSQDLTVVPHQNRMTLRPAAVYSQNASHRIRPSSI
jgi:hypothetical protein